jgi:hypothetical protein
MHAEAIIESCLAAAEAKLTPEAGPGTHTARFKELLVASIEIDRQQTEEEAELMMWPVDAETGGITSLAVTKSAAHEADWPRAWFPAASKSMAPWPAIDSGGSPSQWSPQVLSTDGAAE